MEAQIRAIQAALTEWFEARAPREKRLLVAGVALLIVVLLYSVLWAPAWDGCSHIRASLPRLQDEVAQVQMQLDEARSLKGDAAIRAPEGVALRDALSASLSQAGVPAPQITVLGKGVQVEVKNVPFGVLMVWLDEVRRTEHVRVVSAHAKGEMQPGHASVSVTLQPAAEQ
ncbi:MAG: type II secretion system protein M [Pseudomonadota bacterium]|jgi:general secretion pathway protein M|uniref:type II secretion system protein GspM n=1 Tax=Burkholderiaceae TaxID=119060 RepID=UPI0010F76CA7|nr:type II secretion system protein M [Burkholderia sp. 4M9327F10]